MKRKSSLLAHVCFALSLTSLLAAHANNQTPTAANSANQSAPIPMDQLGAVAGKRYQGDGLSVSATPEGARLRCAFQRLEGQVTREGLWLSSTADNSSGERFRVVAMEVGRVTSDFAPLRRDKPCAPLEEFGFDFNKPLTRCRDCVTTLSPSDGERDGVRGLPHSGIVSVTDNMARFIRPGLTEEYTVSVDGVRQDFIIEQRPEGGGELRVELDVTGAKAEPLVNGARLVLDGSGRKLAYNRLRVTDATGRELSARMEVIESESGDSGRAGSPLFADGAHRVTRPTLAVVVDDAAAIYPVRIDPTFSDADWISMNASIPGANGPILALAVDNSGMLYIGGNFTAVGGIKANRIAKWDGVNWTTLGSGVSGSVAALAVLDGDLYVGGNFAAAGGIAASRIARWNGSNWLALGAGVGGVVFPFGPVVNAIAVSGSNVYVGGQFTTAGGSAAQSVAKWNGSNWSALGSGMGGVSFPDSPNVNALALSGSDLYAGGFFTTAGGSPANQIAKWNGTNWTALGLGMNANVYALTVSGSELYAGGAFTTAGGSAINRIAKWNGSNWIALGTGMNSNVTALTFVGSNLFAGGAFTTAGGNTINRMAKWNGIAWSALNSGMDNAVLALAASGNNLFAGGQFSSAGSNTATRVAKWNGNNWEALGLGQAGVPLYVAALAVSGSDLYAGGRIPTVNGNIWSHVARWDGNSWTTLGSGMNGSVFALAVSGSNIYAGGSFTMAGGNTVNSIAKWDGSNWMPLGQGMVGLNRYSGSQIVYALAISGDEVYAGGNFTTVNGNLSADRIAKWNGTSWTALGLGIGTDNDFPAVYALAVSSNSLYVGGTFTTAGGISANAVAKWDGSIWSSMDSGMGVGSPFAPTVYALTISGGDVLAGGFFSTAGGNTATNIAKWDGNTWSAFGVGMNGTVRALSVLGSNVYAGGQFTTAGGSAAKYIAQWDGSIWLPLGSGMDDFVSTLGVMHDGLYVGGGFATAGDKASPYLAKAILDLLPGRFTNVVHSPATGFICTFLDASVGQPYRIQTSPSLAAGSWTDFTNFTYTAPTVITATTAGSTNRFFRAITP